jgi:hypothetical protein
MKQLFLSLALLTSGFVYSADLKLENIDLNQVTLAQVGLSPEQVEDLKKVIDFRGMQALDMEAPAFSILCNVIRHNKDITCRVGLENLHLEGNDCGWYMLLRREKDQKNFDVSWIAQKGSFLATLFSKAWHSGIKKD